jgi:hypothetical protein
MAVPAANLDPAASRTRTSPYSVSSNSFVVPCGVGIGDCGLWRTSTRLGRSSYRRHLADPEHSFGTAGSDGTVCARSQSSLPRQHHPLGRFCNQRGIALAHSGFCRHVGVGISRHCGMGRATPRTTTRKGVQGVCHTGATMGSVTSKRSQRENGIPRGRFLARHTLQRTRDSYCNRSRLPPVVGKKPIVLIGARSLQTDWRAKPSGERITRLAHFIDTVRAT